MTESFDIALKIVGIGMLLYFIGQNSNHTHPSYEQDCPICVQELCVSD